LTILFFSAPQHQQGFPYGNFLYCQYVEKETKRREKRAGETKQNARMTRKENRN
jgi:hypothetical protein